MAAALAACTVPAPIDTASLPPGVFGAGDQDLPAVQLAQTAFVDTQRSYGNPAAGAEAVLALEYLAGEMNTGARWSGLSAGTKQDLLQARTDLRAAVGIAPDAPSQRVVDSLLQARNDLASGDTAAAEKALDNPAFPAGGAKTVEVLGNLPYVRMANVATREAAEEAVSPDQVGPPQY
jgi:hypothetical protein